MLAFGAQSFGQEATQVLHDTEAKDSTQGQQGDLGAMGLEDLMNVKVGGGTMPIRDLKDVTASMYVLTAADIKKSGATNVPDMLRLVPGVSVAQVDNNKWMVAIRGFSSRFNNKLQVLIDGRSIYSPAFSGVYWDQIGLTPDEIERIEVIRGSDGSLWGSNAVNGIINIVTKNSSDTQGGLLQEQVTTHMAGDHYFRLGSTTKNGNTFRFTARSERFGQSEAQNYPSPDASESNWLHFRSDSKLSARDSLTVTSSYFNGKEGQSTLVPTLDNPMQIVDSRFPVSEFNTSASLVTQHSDRQVSEVKANYNRDVRLAPEFGMDIATLDLGYNHSTKLDEKSSIFYGTAFRQVDGHVTGSTDIWPTRPYFNPSTFSAYGQYEKDLGPRTQFTFGSTIEHNAYSGWEVQPSARLLCRKDPTESYWFSISRAVRTPSPADTNASFLFGISQDPDSGLPVRIIGITDDQFKSEAVVSLETGWRKQESDKLNLDITAFYNDYTNLRSIEFVDNQVVMDATPHIDSNYIFRNSVSAHTYGAEASIGYRANDLWNLTGNLSYIGDHFSLRNGAIQPFPLAGVDGSGSVPKWMANIRSSWILNDTSDFDLSAYYTSANPVFNLPAYTRVDARYSAKLPNNWHLTLMGQNLLGPSHLEGTTSFSEVPMRVRRTLSLQIGYRF
ncbi:MAG: TonB-dependent receptor [Armatimonadetes bacterium]|nr:TonB-dependent receptor [Armatimonadota bacterium]MBS1725663.1 TonB-dependent receptor [Armatimonadota bacterium]